MLWILRIGQSGCNEGVTHTHTHLLIRASKLGSGRSDLLDTSFLRQVGHSLLLKRQDQSIHQYHRLY